MADRNLEKTKYFVLAFCMAFVVLSLIGVAVGLLLGRGGVQQQEQQMESDRFYLPRGEDNMTILMIGREQENTAPKWFFLVKLDAEKGAIPITVFPPGTLAPRREGGEQPLSALYDQGGVRAVQEGLSALLEVPIDRYAQFTADALIKTVDTVGAMEYELPVTLSYQGAEFSVNLARGRQQIDGRKFYDVLRYPAYQTEEKKYLTISQLLSAYINRRLYIVLEPQADQIFQEVINLVDSDISYSDFDSRREALTFLAKLSGSHSYPVLARGIDGAVGMQLSTSTLEQIQKVY